MCVCCGNTRRAMPQYVVFLTYPLEGIMDCPVCGAHSGSVSVVVGVVKIATYHCTECQKVWRQKELLVEFSLEVLQVEMKNLWLRYPTNRSECVLTAIRYMEAKIRGHLASQLDDDTGRRRRAMDLWETRFLQQAIGEEY